MKIYILKTTLVKLVEPLACYPALWINVGIRQSRRECRWTFIYVGIFMPTQNNWEIIEQIK